MKPELKPFEVEPVRRGDDDFTVDHAIVGQSGEKRRVQLRKIAIERPQIAALDEDVGPAAEDERAKSVPLRLVEEGADR